MNLDIYNKAYHNKREQITNHASQVILSIVNEMVEIKSMCDVGGGIGVWTRTAQRMHPELSNDNFICLDGSYIDKSLLVVDNSQFIETDLENTIEIDHDSFSLVISLEVAEHLSPKRSKGFVDDITKLGDVILFSAAPVGQGGEGHINERPMKYWVTQFANHGYEAFDIVRPRIQEDKRIPFWYRQNMLLYVRKDSEHYGKFSKCAKPLIHVVTEDMYEMLHKEALAYRGSISYKLYKLERRIRKWITFK